MPTRKNKYGVAEKSRRQNDGITFASLAEKSRYLALKRMQDEGQISDLERQPRYPIVINGQQVRTLGGRPMRYTADFAYCQNGQRVVEDVKGMRTPDSDLRIALVQHIYGIKITIVGVKNGGKR